MELLMYARNHDSWSGHRMRITIVSRIYAPEPGAAPQFLASLANSLAARGHTVQVLTAKPPKHLRVKSAVPAASSVKNSAVRVRYAPVLRDKTGYLRGYIQYLSFDIPLFFRLLFCRRQDLVFVEPPPTTGLATRIACAFKRTPYVYDAADIWSDAAVHATSSRLVLGLLRRVERWVINGARQAVTVFDGYKNRLRVLGVKTPIAVTGFGADTTAFRYEPATPEKLLIYAGTYTQLHGAEILVDAFALFSETHPGYTLRFVGVGFNGERMLRRMRELSVKGSLELLPPIPERDLRSQLCAAAVALATLLPGNNYEYAFTTKLFSALACGTPVLFAGGGPTGAMVSELGRQVSGNCGLAVDYSARDIAAAMRQLVDVPLSVAGRKTLAEWTWKNHSLTAVSARVCDVLERVVRVSR